MADRKQARKLLDELPPQDLKALEELAHWQESVAGAEGFKPEDRAQVLAMLEEAAQPRLKKLARDYPGAAKVQQTVLWTRIHDYWRLAGQACARAFEAQPLPQLAAGALRAFAQQLKWQHLRYGPIDAAVWGRMNAIYAAAEAKGIGPAAKPEFLKAALFGASAMDSRLAAEMGLAERLIETLAAGFALEKSPAPGLPYWIDLGRRAPSREPEDASFHGARALRRHHPDRSGAPLQGNAGEAGLRGDLEGISDAALGLRRGNPGPVAVSRDYSLIISRALTIS